MRRVLMAAALVGVAALVGLLLVCHRPRAGSIDEAAARVGLIKVSDSGDGGLARVVVYVRERALWSGNHPPRFAVPRGMVLVCYRSAGVEPASDRDGAVVVGDAELHGDGDAIAAMLDALGY